MRGFASERLFRRRPTNLTIRTTSAIGYDESMKSRVPYRGLLRAYDAGKYFCEVFGPKGVGHTRKIRSRLDGMDIATLQRRARDAGRELFNLGITFTVYSDREAIDRILPSDVIPRVISNKDWVTIESGVKQRVAAINLFLHDVYNDQKIIKDGMIPAALVEGNACFRPEMRGFRPPHGIYVHICGTNIVRDEKGKFRVLEDNARTPSGVSYVIENRHLMMRAFPDLAEGLQIAEVDDYGSQLARALRAVAPKGVSSPTVALLSPGVYNSAYFEHVFIAREMGGPLVQGQDLVVENDRVYMRTTAGLEPVHVIYRRIDDDFLDPKVFRSDSALGSLAPI